MWRCSRSRTERQREEPGLEVRQPGFRLCSATSACRLGLPFLGLGGGGGAGGGLPAGVLPSLAPGGWGVSPAQ